MLCKWQPFTCLHPHAVSASNCWTEATGCDVGTARVVALLLQERETEECLQVSRLQGGGPTGCCEEVPNAFGVLGASLPGGERLSRRMLTGPVQGLAQSAGPPEPGAPQPPAGLHRLGRGGPGCSGWWGGWRWGPNPARPSPCPRRLSHVSRRSHGQGPPATSLLLMHLCLLNTSHFQRKLLFWVTDDLNVSEAFCPNSPFLFLVKRSLC